MITYIPFKAEHGVKIASMINGNFLRMMEVHEKLGQSLTALYGDEILCCGGIDPVWEGVGEAWTVNGPLTKVYPLTFHKTIARWLKLLSRKYGLVRIQSIVDVADPMHVKWIEALGFEREGVLRKYHWGKDYAIYARIEGVR